MSTDSFAATLRYACRRTDSFAETPRYVCRRTNSFAETPRYVCRQTDSFAETPRYACRQTDSFAEAHLRNHRHAPSFSTTDMHPLPREIADGYDANVACVEGCWHDETTLLTTRWRVKFRPFVDRKWNLVKHGEPGRMQGIEPDGHAESVDRKMSVISQLCLLHIDFFSPLSKPTTGTDGNKNE